MGQSLENLVAHKTQQAFILRLWQENPAAPWKVYLKDVTSGRYFIFLGLEGLAAYLLARTSPENLQDRDSWRSSDA
jgi:hypothetical protein